MKPYYDQSGVTIYHGDNCEVMAALPSESIDLAVTSPPYDDLRTYGGHSWDFEALAAQLVRVLKPGGVIVWVVADATVNGSETLTSMRQAIHFKDVCGLNVHDTMVWHKINALPLTSPRYEPAWEYMIVLAKGQPAKWNPLKDKSKYGGVRQCGSQISEDGSRRKKWSYGQPINEMKVRQNVWPYVVGSGRSDGAHPAAFPDALAKDHIASWSNPGDVVLDPFAGSGTTLKAAKELGRKAIGIEINADYLPIITNRLSQEVFAL